MTIKITMFQRASALLGALLLAAVLAAPAQARPADRFALGGTDCSLIEVPAAAPAAPPFGIGACPGVRPGAVVESDRGFCTFNFLFTGSDGHRYMGTAGHCILGESQFVEEIGEQTWAPGTGPVARDGEGRRIGEFAYAVLQDPKDFALIRLDAGVAANPQMCHFGGPTGVSVSRTRRNVALQLYGDGILAGAISPARTLFGSLRNPHHLFAKGVSTNGDSGAPVTVRGPGRAVGLLIGAGYAVRGGGADAGALISRLPPRERRAEKVTGERFEIITARQR